MASLSAAIAISAALSLSLAFARVIDFEADAGGVADNNTLAAAWHNGALLNATLNALQSGDTLFFANKTFTTMGGIVVRDVRDVVLHLDGTLEYSDNLEAWPRQQGGRVMECLQFVNTTNLTFTSTRKGIFQGNGERWWGIPAIGYLTRGENRPRLLHISDAHQVQLRLSVYLSVLTCVCVCTDICLSVCSWGI